ncbi:MAG: T9SS type A sorting domain-containing protein [Bacteroidota bacterium]
MKNKYFTSLALFLTLSFSNLFAAAGFFEYYINTDLNGVITFHGNYTGGISFDGSNLGTLTDPSDALIIDLTGAKTFENSNDDIVATRLYYRVYKSGDTPGAYSTLELPYFGVGGGNAGDDEWQSNTDIDLTTNISSAGTYNVEIYYEGDGTFPPSGTFNVFENNGGANFIATFEVNASALPVAMNSFKAEKRNRQVGLLWQTFSEVNNSHFEIERSSDANNWQYIGRVNGNGHSYEKNNYEYIDTRPHTGMNYYRLKQVDFDGKFEYSKIVFTEFDRTDEINIFPNPVTDYLSFSYLEKTEEQFSILIYDTNGKMILNNKLNTENKINLIDLSSGIYFIQIKNEMGEFILKDRFVKK